MSQFQFKVGDIVRVNKSLGRVVKVNKAGNCSDIVHVVSLYSTPHNSDSLELVGRPCQHNGDGM